MAVEEFCLFRYRQQGQHVGFHLIRDKTVLEDQYDPGKQEPFNQHFEAQRCVEKMSLSKVLSASD